MSEIKYITGDELRKLQLILLDVLIEVDRVCRNNNIKYVIGFGTLLGAVRHKGFIPWDDDVDVCMTREEYDKFAKVANQLNPDICFFQDNDKEKEYPWGYGKVRRTGTSYIRLGQEHLKHKSGFMIDIFPMDDIPQSLLGMRINEKINLILRKITYAQVACKSEKSAFARTWYKTLSFISPRTANRVAKILQKKENNATSNRAYMKFFPSDALIAKTSPQIESYGWDKTWLTDIAEYEFEGHKFYGPKDYHANLIWSYGPNYMTPPPMDDRESHAPCSDYSFGNL